MPSLLFPTLYRYMFPNSRYKRSQDTNNKISLAISGFYVLFAIFSSTWIYQRWKKQETYKLVGESTQEFNLRTMTKKNDLHDPNHKFKIVKIGWSGITTEDVTENVQKNIEKNLGANVEDPNYDKYKDEAYVRNRMNISPDDEKFDLEYCGALLRRKDRRNEFSPALPSRPTVF